MDNIIYISDARVLSIPIKECHEPLIDLKQQTQLLYGPPPETELTRSCYTKIRKTVFDKLCQVQEHLPDGWRLRLYEGFRGFRVQEILFEQEYERVAMRYPYKNSKELFYETTRLVSPVRNLDGTINIPPHNTGGAVDIEVIANDGSLINMGMSIKDWPHVDPELCLTDYPFLPEEARHNRSLLAQIMEAHDFVNYPTEWWHFSYGDRYWAFRKKNTHALYGSADFYLQPEYQAVSGA